MCLKNGKAFKDFAYIFLAEYVYRFNLAATPWQKGAIVLSYALKGKIKNRLCVYPLSPLHNLHLLLRQPIQPINQLINPSLCMINGALEMLAAGIKI